MAKTVTKAALKKISKNLTESQAKAMELKEAVVTQQFRAKKLVTEAKGNELLEFKTAVPYYNEKGEVTTIMVKYQDLNGSGFYSISVKDILNKLTDTSGVIIAESVTFDTNGNWKIPAVIEMKQVTQPADNNKVYPLAAYKLYRSSIFKEAQDELSDKIDAIKAGPLRADAKWFLEDIVVELNVNNMLPS